MDSKETSALVDGILKTGLLVGVVGAGLMAPNAIVAFDKPVRMILDSLDKRSREREFRRVCKYMMRQGLLKGEYQHGLQITNKGVKRLKDKMNSLKGVSIPQGLYWDNTWRLVVYDIPEIKKNARSSFSRFLKRQGFWQLQRSVWVYPLGCRDEVEFVAYKLGVDRYVTYLESGYIDNQQELVRFFENRRVIIS